MTPGTWVWYTENGERICGHVEAVVGILVVIKAPGYPTAIRKLWSVKLDAYESSCALRVAAVS